MRALLFVAVVAIIAFVVVVGAYVGRKSDAFYGLLAALLLVAVLMYVLLWYLGVDMVGVL